MYLTLTVVAVLGCASCEGITIFDELVDREQETLLSMFNFAGITEILSSEGPITVFLPTQYALNENLPEGLLDQLVADADALREVLLGHIVPGERLTLKNLENDMVLSTAANQRFGIRVNKYEGKATIAGVPITAADVAADNGVLHFTNFPLLRPVQGDYAASLSEVPMLTEGYSFEALKRLLELTTADASINGLDGMTFLAPIDSSQFTVTTVEAMFNDQPGDLDRLLYIHVIPETLFSAGLRSGMEVATMDGTILIVDFDIDDGYVFLNENGERVADLIAGDVPTTNGVLHVLDQPILSNVELPKFEAKSTTDGTSQGITSASTSTLNYTTPADDVGPRLWH